MAIDPNFLRANPVYQAPVYRPPTPPPQSAVQVGPVTQLQNQQAQGYAMQQASAASQASAQRAAANPFINANNQTAQMFGGGAPAGGGDGGFLGGLIQSISAPLNLLAAPGRAVVSGVEELTDLAKGRDASFSDWWNQTKDPGYGFGTYLEHENIDLGKWGNRIAGFIGDVALDPLTYATFGTSEFMGSAGRATLANLARESGLGEEVISKVGRLGESALSKADREVMDLGRAGVRFGLPSHNVPIPGTGGLARGVGGAFAAARAPFSGTKVAEAVRRLGGSRAPELRPFVERLATGKGELTAEKAAASWAAQQSSSAVSQEYLSRFSRDVHRLGTKLRGQADVMHLVEAGKQTGRTKAWKTLTDDMLGTSTGEYGVEMAGRANYVPHYITRDFNEWLGRSGGDDAKQIIDNLGETSGRMMARKFEPGKTYRIHGKEITFDPGRAVTMRDIDDKFKAAFPQLQGMKLVEDDPEQVINRLLTDMASDAGETSRLNTFRDAGIIKPTEEVTEEQRIAWKDATPAERKSARKIANARNKQYKDLAKGQREWRGALAEGGKRQLQKVVTAEEVMLERAKRLQDIAAGRLDETAVAQAENIARRKGALGWVRGRALRGTPDDQQFDLLVGQLNQLDSAIKGLKTKIASSEDPAYRMALKLAQDRRAQLEEVVTKGKGASQKLFDARLRLQRAEAAAAERAPTSVPPVPGPGAGLELATPETSRWGAQRQAVIDADLAQQAAEHGEAQGTLGALAPATPPAGPELEQALADLGGATERREALLALTGAAPKGRTEAAKAGRRYHAFTEVGRRQAATAEKAARERVQAFGRPREEFIAQLAELATGKPTRPGSEVQALIKKARKDPTRMRDILAGLKDITGKSQRGLTPRGGKAVRRELTMEELSRADLPAEVMELLPDDVQRAIKAETGKLDEMLNPYRYKGDPRGLNFQPENDLDWSQAADPFTNMPTATKRHQERVNGVTTKLKNLQAEEVQSRRGVEVVGKGPARPEKWEVTGARTEDVEDLDVGARRANLEELADLEHRWNEQGWIIAERKRIQDMRDELSKEVIAHRGRGPTQAKRIEHAQLSIDEVNKRRAALAKRERELPELLTPAERQELALDIRVVEQRLDEIGPTPTREVPVVSRTQRPRQGVESRVQRQPRQYAADPYAAKRKKLTDELSYLRHQYQMGRKARETTGPTGRIFKEEFTGKLTARQQRSVSAIRSVQKELDALPAPPLTPRQEQIKKLSDELAWLQKNAPGEKSNRESDRFAGLGSPMDSSEIRGQADRVARLNDVAYRYKRALEEGAEPGQDTLVQAARSVLEEERVRDIAKHGRQRMAVGRHGDADPMHGPGKPRWSDQEVGTIVDRRWEQEKTARVDQAKDWTRERKRADTDKAKATAAYEKAKAAGELKPAKRATKSAPARKSDTALYEQRLKDIEASVPAKPEWMDETPAAAERAFKDEQRSILGRDLMPVEGASNKEQQDAIGEFFQQFLMAPARTIIDARKKRSFFRKLERQIEKGDLAEATTPEALKAEAFEQIGYDPKTGQAFVKGHRKLQNEEAARQLDIGRRRVTAEVNPFEERDPTEILDMDTFEAMGGEQALSDWLQGKIGKEIGGAGTPGAEFDTHAMIQGVDEQLRNGVIEEERAFGELLKDMTGSRWREVTGEPKRLWAGSTGKLTEGAAGPIHPRDIGGRGKGATLSPGRVATIVAGRGQARAKEFLGGLFEKLTPQAKDQVLEVIKREMDRTGLRLNDLDTRIGRLGGEGQKLRGDILDLLLGEGRPRGEVPEGVDVSKFFGPGRYGKLAGERGRYQAAEREVGQAIEQARGVPEPSLERITPQTQAELDRLAGVQAGERAGPFGGYQAAKRRTLPGMGKARVEAIRREMEPLLEQERAGRKMAQRLREGPTLEIEAKEIAENELLGQMPERQTLEALTGNREAIKNQLALVQERIRTREKNFPGEWSALNDTEKILAGQADERLNDAVAIERGVKTAQARVKGTAGIDLKTKVNTVAAYEKLVADVRSATEAGADEQTLNLLRSAADLVPKMKELDESAQFFDRAAKMARSDQMTPIIRNVLNSNYTAFATNVTGQKLAIDRTVKDAFDQIDKIVMHAKPGTFGKVFDSYTRFFKAYATMTPGFHVRNALGAIFMNSSDGVGFANQIRGVKIWTKFRNGGYDSLDELERKVVRAVYGSGAGGHFVTAEVGAAASGQMAKGKAGRWVMQNRAVAFNRRSGEAIEGAVRAGMALDTLSHRGGSVERATSRINRIHFNYDQVSEFDAKMRRVVPFWTFMSRNVPLQLQQMMIRPRTYLNYEKFKKNFGEDESGEFPFMPKYLKDLGAFRLTPGLALAPEFGPTQAQENIRELGSMKMLSNLNPVLKDIGQVLTKQNFYYGRPYEESDYQEVKGEISPLGPVFAALGLTENIPGGGQAVPRMWADVARDLVPQLSQINRLAGTTPEREGRTTQAMWNLLGFPGKQLTPEVLAAERRRREGTAYYGQQSEDEKQSALWELSRGY